MSESKIRVRAKQPCFVANRLQAVGDTFDVAPEGFNPKVMERVGGAAAPAANPRVKPGGAAAKKPAPASPAPAGEPAADTAANEQPQPDASAPKMGAGADAASKKKPAAKKGAKP